MRDFGLHTELDDPKDNQNLKIKPRINKHSSVPSSPFGVSHSGDVSDTELILARAVEELFHSPCVGALKKLDLFVWWEEMLSLRRFQAKLSPLFPAVKKR